MKFLILIFGLSFLINFCDAKRNLNKRSAEETEGNEKLEYNIQLNDNITTEYITSPGFPNKHYPKNSQIEYNVMVNLSDIVDQLSVRVLITFEYFGVQQSKGCTKDGLEIIEPNGHLQTFCGVHAGKTIISQSTKLRFHFYSDSFEEDRGFKIRIDLLRSECSRTFINVTKGVIESPNYPNDYRKEETCVWSITVSNDSYVRVTFDQLFDVFSSSQVCGEDYVLISKSADFEDDIHRFCGKQSPDVVVSYANTMLIKFNSDCCNTGKGFRLTFEESDKPEAAPELLPPLTPEGCPCGKENLNSFRIVGGTEVNPPHRYPWMVSITSNLNAPFCGGVLINNFYVLTATHCVIDESESKIRVRIGQHSLKEPTPMLEVSKIIKHKDYDPVSQFNDIALLRLKHPIQYSRNILPVCLPRSDLSDPEGLFVAGWGRIDEGGRTSDLLHEINLPPVSNAKCAAKFGGLVTEKHMCAGALKGKDACQGDSGGPLTTRIGNRVSVVGVVSWGIGCAREGNPGVYTRVTHYLSWIEANTKDARYCLPVKNGNSGNLPNDVEEPPVMPNYPNCGIPNLKPSTRVVGGTEAIPHEFPWTAVISYNGQLIGAGSLIASNIILTAARKLKPYSSQYTISNLRVIVGAHQITKSESIKRVYNVNRIIIHPQNGQTTPMDYDFALIELQPPREGFLSLHRPVCLPRRDTPFIVGSPVIAAGWGRTSTNGPGSSVLRKVTFLFSDRNQCNKIFNNGVTKSMVCVEGEGRDMCMGDGGGPLMKYLEGRMYLVGLSSWGSAEGCDVGKPNVFADVRHALPWITAVTGIPTA